MSGSHGRLVMAVMALVMASLACDVRWEGAAVPSPSMTAAPVMDTSTTPQKPSITEESTCLLVHALPGGEGSLNLRAGAGTSYPVITVLHDGQTLVMDGRSGDWFAVTVVMDGRTITGYVHSDYVEDCK